METWSSVSSVPFCVIRACKSDDLCQCIPGGIEEYPLDIRQMNTTSSATGLPDEPERRFRKNLEMLNPHAAGLDLHKEEIWSCPN